MWRRVVVLWLASRVVLVALGLLFTSQLAWHRKIETWQSQPWQALTGWDTVYYITISHTGYAPGQTLAFFPLYPLLIRGFRELSSSGDAVASLGVAALALLAAMAGLAVLARDRLSLDHANRSLLYLILSPFGFVLALAYTEALFLALAAWLFVCSDRRRYGPAIALGLAAGLTRVTALALVAPLLVVAWRRRSIAAATVAVTPALGVAAFMAYLHDKVNDALAFVHAQSGWGGHATFPLFAPVEELIDFAHDHHPVRLLGVAALIAYLLLLIPILRRPIFAAHRVEDTLFVAGVFFLPLVSGVMQSTGRFGLVAFPLWFALADVGLRKLAVHRTYVVFAPVVQIVLFAYVALGYLVP